MLEIPYIRKPGAVYGGAKCHAVKNPQNKARRWQCSLCGRRYYYADAIEAHAKKQHTKRADKVKAINIREAIIEQ